jgi:uncharacterized protein DUF4410
MRPVAFAIGVALGLAGCASTPTRTGYLRDYDQLKPGRHLDQYWANRALITQKSYSKIRLGEIDVGRISAHAGVTPEDCKAWFENALRKTPSAHSEHLVADDTAPAQLEVAITEMDPGSAAARIFAGELGAGHAWVQVEGRVVDRQSQDQVVAWSARRSSSGTIGIQDVGGDAGPALVRAMLEQIAIDLDSELRETFTF